jgi:hypothetical protein
MLSMVNMAEGWKSCKPNSQSITTRGYLYIIYIIYIYYITYICKIWYNMSYTVINPIICIWSICTGAPASGFPAWPMSAASKDRLGTPHDLLSQELSIETAWDISERYKIGCLGCINLGSYQM